MESVVDGGAFLPSLVVGATTNKKRSLEAAMRPKKGKTNAISDRVCEKTICLNETKNQKKVIFMF